MANLTPRGARWFASVLSLIGVAVLGFGARSLLEAQASPGWPTASGKVFSSRVDSKFSDGSATYHAAVCYSFSVGGQTYSSAKIAFGDYGSSNPSHAEELVNRYPEGAAVTVHFSPKNPDLAVLEPGIQGQAFGLPILGAVFFVAGCFAFVKMPQAIARQTAARKPLTEP